MPSEQLFSYISAKVLFPAKVKTMMMSTLY